MGRIRKRVNNQLDILYSRALEDIKTKKISIRLAAETYGLKYETLRDRKHGAQNRSQGHRDQQHLTEEEENSIERWIGRVDDYGWPPNIDYVKQLALGFIRSHGILNPQLGKNWITRFLDRHPKLTTKFATRLDKQRSYASNPIILRDFFHKVSQLLVPNL